MNFKLKNNVFEADGKSRDRICLKIYGVEVSVDSST
jgi:hypothetical protein